jgi:hypothetical protein
MCIAPAATSAMTGSIGQMMEVMVVPSIIGVVSSLELVDLAASPRFKRVRDLARNWHPEGD